VNEGFEKIVAQLHNPNKRLSSCCFPSPHRTTFLLRIPDGTIVANYGKLSVHPADCTRRSNSSTYETDQSNGPYIKLCPCQYFSPPSYGSGGADSYPPSLRSHQLSRGVHGLVLDMGRGVRITITRRTSRTIGVGELTLTFRAVFFQIDAFAVTLLTFEPMMILYPLIL
jgi:hypothetical protein